MDTSHQRVVSEYYFACVIISHNILNLHLTLVFLWEEKGEVGQLLRFKSIRELITTGHHNGIVPGELNMIKFLKFSRQLRVVNTNKFSDIELNLTQIRYIRKCISSF